jgi:hypothetical protein
MSTIAPTPPPSAVHGGWGTAALAEASAVAPRPVRSHEAWRELPSDLSAVPSSSAEAAFAAGRLVILTLVALVLLAPFAPGLILIGLAAAILAVPYVLVRRVLRQQ